MKYELVRKDTNKINVNVYGTGDIFVNAPIYMPLSEIEAYIDKNESKIKEKLEKIDKYSKPTHVQTDYNYDIINDLMVKAKDYIPSRMEYYSKIVGVECKKAIVTFSVSYWGNCNIKKELRFNCMLMLLDEDEIDYVIVHELCHIKHHNHSKKFWSEVEKVMPNRKEVETKTKAKTEAILKKVKKDNEKKS